MVSLLRDKYKPIYTSELEYDYPEISEALNNFNFFIISGTKFSGKTTILKLYLSINNFDYLYLSENNVTIDYIKDIFRFKSNSIESYFSNKKYIIVIDNFETFSNEIKKYLIDNYNKLNNKCVLITNEYRHKSINIINIKKYSYEYLCNLYENILFLEKCNNKQDIPFFNNINEMYSFIEYLVIVGKFAENGNNASNDSNDSNESKASNDSNESNNYEIELKYDFKDYTLNDYFQETDLEKKQYILERSDNVLQFQLNIAHNIENIHDLADSYNAVCDSTYFLTNYNYEYYYQLNLLSTSRNKLKNKEFKIYKKTLDLRLNKNNLNYDNK